MNHTLGNLDQQQDLNPVTIKWVDSVGLYAARGIQSLKPTGWESNDIV